MDRTANARRLRSAETMAEAKLWAIVRAGRLQGFKFKRQVPIDRYFVDFLCGERRLVVELDGKAHEERELYNAERTQVLEACGFHVMRFPNENVLTNPGNVAETILSMLNTRGPNPSPSHRCAAGPSLSQGRGFENGGTPFPFPTFSWRDTLARGATS
jgi:very-short-patch-repair endonuclease